ncbi:hypothetical protein Q0590_00065 [Rhodocytophaga aerolata]|uniref:Uncharacterized protein n=1 Tax=Rhodocytophaga aerolata TaxID=455078 RepID=A0ABT8QXP4_9BACT|nr:hypothetical protein [Rhodocytophaga aerolata]MDO1444618.1 hypothetical protein [Rhodocytophaga aerolata]
MKQPNKNIKVSNSDVRFLTEIDELLKQIPAMKYKPMVGVYDLREILKVMKELPKLTFPIKSAGELIEKLGGSGKTFRIESIDVDPVRMIKYMPAYYFPIADMGNFLEKMAELIQQNRYKADLPKEMKNIQEQTSGALHFPIENRESLFAQLSTTGRSFTYQGRKVNLEQVIRHIPDNYFPIKTEKDFYARVTDLIVSRPLIVPHTS